MLQTDMTHLKISNRSFTEESGLLKAQSKLADRLQVVPPSFPHTHRPAERHMQVGRERKQNRIMTLHQS